MAEEQRQQHRLAAAAAAAAAAVSAGSAEAISAQQQRGGQGGPGLHRAMAERQSKQARAVWRRLAPEMFWPLINSCRSELRQESAEWGSAGVKDRTALEAPAAGTGTSHHEAQQAPFASPSCRGAMSALASTDDYKPSVRSRDVGQLGRQPALRVRQGAQVEVPLLDQGAVQAVVAAPVEAVDGAIGCAVDAAPAAHVGHRLVPAHDGVGVAERLPVGNRVALGQQGLADACGGGGGAAEAGLRGGRHTAGGWQQVGHMWLPAACLGGVYKRLLAKQVGHAAASAAVSGGLQPASQPGAPCPPASVFVLLSCCASAAPSSAASSRATSAAGALRRGAVIAAPSCKARQGAARGPAVPCKRGGRVPATQVSSKCRRASSLLEAVLEGRGERGRPGAALARCHIRGAMRRHAPLRWRPGTHLDLGGGQAANAACKPVDSQEWLPTRMEAWWAGLNCRSGKVNTAVSRATPASCLISLHQWPMRPNAGCQ